MNRLLAMIFFILGNFIFLADMMFNSLTYPQIAAFLMLDLVIIFLVAKLCIKKKHGLNSKLADDYIKQVEKDKSWLHLHSQN